MRAVAVAMRHRTWCSLWAPSAWCDCGGVDAVDLVEWWAAAARVAPLAPEATIAWHVAAARGFAT